MQHQFIHQVMDTDTDTMQILMFRLKINFYLYNNMSKYLSQVVKSDMNQDMSPNHIYMDLSIVNNDADFCV